MDICITSGSRGGTGKTTFSIIMAHVLKYIYQKNIVIINLSKIPYKIKTDIDIETDIVDGDIRIYDFPAFHLSDRDLLSLYLSCRNIVFVADEDPHTLESARTFLKLARGRKLGILINMIIGRPKLRYIVLYSKYSKIYLIPFDEQLRIYRANGVDPIRLRSVGVAKMVKVAVDIARKLNS
ncbi:MAG: ATPase [Thermoproteus sp.]